MLSNMKIGIRLGLSYLFMLIIIVILVALAFTKMAKMEEGLDHIVKSNHVKAELAFKASSSYDALKEAILALMIAQTDELKTRERTSIDEARKSYSDALNELKRLETGKEGIEILERLETNRKTAADSNNKVMTLIAAGQTAEAAKLFLEEAMALNDKLSKSFAEISAYQNKRMVVRHEEAISAYNAAKWQMSIITIIAIALVVVISLLVTRSITIPVKQMTSMLQDIAQGEGDLTKKLQETGKDELSEASHWFNIFISKLRGIISNIADTSTQVASAANQLQATAIRIATGAEEVAAQAATVATASEEMSATSSSISDSCHHAADESSQASQAAVTGSSVVSSTICGMEQISSRVRSSAATVSSLGARSDQIGAIVATIEDIADQTNLLALNAAIEAARAGEQGRGFAVVADEVRALAERTTRATREIGEMIKAIQTETKAAVSEMELGVKEVQQGSEDAAKSGEALQEILSTINEVAMQVNQIATAAEEQTATTSEITSNIHQITEVVQDTASGAHESATAASRLNDNAEELQRLVRQFKL